MDRNRAEHYFAAGFVTLGTMVNFGMALWQKKQWNELSAQTWLEHEASMFVSDQMVTEALVTNRYAGLSEEEMVVKFPEDYQFYRMQKMHELEALSIEEKKVCLKQYKARAKENWEKST